MSLTLSLRHVSKPGPQATGRVLLRFPKHQFVIAVRHFNSRRWRLFDDDLRWLLVLQGVGNQIATNSRPRTSRQHASTDREFCQCSSG